MTGKLMAMSDKELKARIRELEDTLFDDAGKLKNAQKIGYLSPVLQMYTGELSGRFAKRTTLFALGIAFLSLLISGAALAVTLSVQPCSGF